MTHPPIMALARRFATWQFQARTYHRLLRDLTESAEEVTEGVQVPDGMIMVRLPLAAWRAARDEALSAPPEPLPTKP